MQRHNVRSGEVAILIVAAVAMAAFSSSTAQEPKARPKGAAEKSAAKTSEKADAKKADKMKGAADKKAAANPKEQVGGGYTWAKVDLRAGENRKYVVTGLRNFPVKPESIATFDGYYTGYGFKRLIDPKFLPQITEVRREFQRDLRDAKDVRGTTQDAFNHLNELAARILPYIIKDISYHPVSRYNATLILGDLNHEKATSDRAAIPLPQALPVLIGDILMDPRQSDAVRVAALIGIRRHAESMREHDAMMLAAGRAMTISTMLKIAGASKPAPNRTPEGHHWMRRQAVEILGALGDVGAGGAVANALVAVADEKEAPLWLRCSAAESLGRLKFKPTDAAAVKPEVVAKVLRSLSADVCRAEVERANSDNTPVSQEQLLADLGCVQSALKDALVLLSSTHPQKTAVADLVKKFETLYGDVAKANGGELSSASVESGLRQMLASAAPAVAPPKENPMTLKEEPKKPDDKPMPEPAGTDAPGDLEFE
jgi:hypothetical protein